jgi:putative transposase
MIQRIGNMRLSLRVKCRILEVSRTGYYRFLQRSKDKQCGLEVRNLIQKIALKWRSYGYRRVTAELRRCGNVVNGKRVLRWMRQDNLLCLRKRRFVRTTRSDHEYAIYRNLAKDFRPTATDQLWVSDITYIRLENEFVYLAVILDAFSRRCIGWSLARYLDNRLTIEALHMALKNRHTAPGLIHHSDQGVQYASDRYTRILTDHGIRISMSRKANPYDNAMAESFIKTLKYEEVLLFEYSGLDEARRRIRYFLEDVYNRKRLHSSLNYVPPEEFEIQMASI